MPRHSFLKRLPLLCLGPVLLVAARGEDSADHLTTNGRSLPLGIAADDISFGWALASEDRGVTQSAWQIRVGSAAEGDDVWNPGSIRSDQQVDIRLPENVKLAPSTRYFWQVRTWDGDGGESAWSEPAWFETGLLSESDWKGAEWIARPVARPDIAEWTDYRVALEFTLVNEAFGVLLRASENGGDAYLWQLNLTSGSPVLRPHRKKGGNYEVLDDVDLSKLGFTVDDLRKGTHTLVFDVVGSRITTSLDGKEVDRRTDNAFRRGFVGLRTHGNEKAQVHRLKITSQPGGKELLSRDFGDAGKTVSGATEQVLTGTESSLPLLRGIIDAKDEVASARLYASARGIYELTCNGEKVGDQFLAPGWTDYDQRIQSQTYDLTGLVRKGPNVIGAALADGWYHGKVGLGWNKVYGDRLAFVAKIKLTYADGSTQWFATRPDWKASSGPWVSADLQDGEHYDASLEQPGWDTPGFDASSWTSVEVTANDSDKLVPQPDEPVRETGLLTARSVSTPDPGTAIYDLGQNMVGITRIRLKGRKGDTATIRHAEELYRTGDRKGRIYTDNFRSARVTDTYTFASDGVVTYQPRFTQHGFRYVEVSGLETLPRPEDVHGVVLGSVLPDTGDLETSSPMLNQLVSNIRWGLRSNFLSIPTDTPARDERLGWTGDINVFAPAACRLKDTRGFFGKWMTDVRDAQKDDGNLPAVVPQPRNEFDATGVGWSDAAITVPYAAWKAWGDVRIVRGNWDAMKAFYDYVHRSATADGNLLEEGRSCWFSGDWLSLEENWNRLEEHKVIATAYFAENTRMMAEMAAAMGDTTNARKWTALHPKIRDAFAEAYIGEDGTVFTGTQTAYALALGMDMIADPALRAKTAQRFVEKLAADGNHLRTGFLGTPWLLPALTTTGHDDLAMKLLLNEDYPSWGFPISIGATTMWERWNSIRADGEFGPVNMNSFNHYAYGAVADWMFGRLAGIEAIEPGYKKSRIAPLIGGGGLTSANATQRTPYGRISSSWKTDGDAFALDVTIPPNTTAEIVLPVADPATVKESGQPLDAASSQDGRVVVHLPSGTYHFAAEW